MDGKRVLTPMLLVMVAIGGTDILFALDSIPAIFGLTQNVFIVFTATAFSLLGLRQLFFLIDGLLDRLIYLSYGLAAILAFIGVKLILHALHENNLPFVNGGEPVEVVEISTGLSLTVILGVLVVTVVASLVSPAGKAQTAIANARRHATSYLDMEYTADQAERERVFRMLLEERDQIVALGPRYKKKVRDEPELMALLTRASDSHDAAHPDDPVEPPAHAPGPGRRGARRRGPRPDRRAAVAQPTRSRTSAVSASSRLWLHSVVTPVSASSLSWSNHMTRRRAGSAAPSSGREGLLDPRGLDLGVGGARTVLAGAEQRRGLRDDERQAGRLAVDLREVGRRRLVAGQAVVRAAQLGQQLAVLRHLVLAPRVRRAEVVDGQADPVHVLGPREVRRVRVVGAGRACRRRRCPARRGRPSPGPGAYAPPANG